MNTNIDRSIEESNKLFELAKKVIPGGVNSPVRAFKSVGGNPIFIDKAKGAYLYDADGNRYIDYIASWGPMILGHANDEVVDALARTAVKRDVLWNSYGIGNKNCITCYPNGSKCRPNSICKFRN